MACIKCSYANATTMRVILDTSVLVAAARSRDGASFHVLSMLPRSKFEIALTVALYTEWQSVLTRPEHLPPGANAEAAIGFLRYLASIAHLQDVHYLGVRFCVILMTTWFWSALRHPVASTSSHTA